MKRIILTGMGCAIFVVASVFTIFQGGFVSTLGGALGFFLFGIAGAWGIKRLLQYRKILILTEAGIAFGAGGMIPWGDLEEVGVGYIGDGSGKTKVFGIRLKSYDNFIRSLPPEEVEAKRRMAKWTQRSAIAMLPLAMGPPEVVKAILTGDYKGLIHHEFLTYPQLDIAAQMMQARKISNGWDLTIASLTFDRPVAQVVEAVKNFHQVVKDKNVI